MFTGRMLFLPPNHSAKAPKAITQGNSVRSKSDGNQVNLTKTEKNENAAVIGRSTPASTGTTPIHRMVSALSRGMHPCKTLPVESRESLVPAASSFKDTDQKSKYLPSF